MKFDYIDKLSSIEKTELYHNIQVKYQQFYQDYYNNIERLKRNYSLFINNNKDKKYLDSIQQDFIKVDKMTESYLELQQINAKLVECSDMPKKNDAYTYMVKTYEQLGDYQKAIEICELALSYGFTEDGTKDGFKGRILKLTNKLDR